ncbi:hypothetical protein SUH3_04565 [Pseudosulfitobacter pseudonitzschiae]|uniref:Uncharacterized protein n=2 Tax=Pseudosulfitobacter pseudonitzschiae TaxID=1402135 RepID=A0A073J6K6_9RHOB|nr:hypothetical protein SUH3_04565 [Pseudosulfitobacter pseudonitzschiae]
MPAPRGYTPPWGAPPQEGWPAPLPSRCADARRFQNGDELWQEAAAYFQHCKGTPFRINKLSKGKVVPVETEHLPTWEGLAAWLSIHVNLFVEWRRPENKRPDLCAVVSQIDNYIRSLAISGGMAGVFNPGLVARYVQLADHSVSNVDATLSPKAPAIDDRNLAIHQHPDMTDDELDAILARGEQPLLFSQAQIDAGVKYRAP